ncbi:MAG: cupin domain-containing protein [Pedobacter sp.]|uniref:cupin domain-containing protein n=1 Tax=Pedobacter sp. TaxID=1411316 RepID=UPI00339A5E1D
MIKSIKNSEHYQWGDHCDGWHLLKTDGLSVIQEMMPAGTTETHHFHNLSQQLFYVLSGTARFEIEGEVFILNPAESIHVAKGRRHCIANHGVADLAFLVISEPKAHGDRVEA